MRRTRPLPLLLVSLWLVCAIGAGAGAEPILWRRVVTPTRGAALRALAAAADGRVVLGDALGISIATGEGRPFERRARIDDVRDVHVDPSGGLWVASLRGLWRVEWGGEARHAGPGAGAAARAALRVASSGEWLAVATAGGAFIRRGSGAFARLGGGLVGQAVRTVALRGAPGGAEIWLVAERGLCRGRLTGEDGPLRADVSRIGAIVGAPVGEPPVDVALGPEVGAAGVAVLYAQQLALREDAGGWHVVRLPLPPGARARRLSLAGGEVWIHHDRGALRGAPPGAFEDARVPGTSAAGVGVVRAGTTWWLATEAALHRAAPVQRGAEIGAHRDLREPDVRAVQRAALRYLDLRVERDRARWRGVGRRGLFPELDLRFNLRDDSFRRSDEDQSFVSGGLRFLFDREHDRGREYEGQVTLSWDLADVAHPEEWDDLSREIRQRIALRDDVLDEINQLYFERRRVIAQREALPSGDPARAALSLRAAELRAGLDAWTGGWFTEQRAVPAGRREPTDAAER